MWWKLRKIMVLTMFLIPLSGIIGCIDVQVKEPENLIPREEFVEIMVDMQLIESIHQVKIDRSQNDFDLDVAYEWLFNERNIDEATFKSSFNYYASKPDEFEKIYDEIIIILSQKEAEVH